MEVEKRRLTPPARGPCDEAAVLDALGSGVICIRDDGVVVRANAGASRILHRSLVDLLGRRIEEIVAPLARLRSLAQRQEDRPEILIALADGTPCALGYSLSAFPATDGHARYVLQFQDIGAIRELRKQRDRLLAMAAVGDALPSVLHELRNPLAAVTSRLELLVEETVGSLQLDLHAMLSELRRMSLGLDGVGGFARAAQVAKRTAVDLAVQDACRTLEPIAARANVRLEARGGPLPLLPLDRGVVGGIVFNLVKNAIDATPPGGSIVVTASLLDEGRIFSLRVEDDGEGMTPEIRARCTDLFFTSKDKGSGIGLALCHHVARSSGGDLDVQSSPGCGTAITFRVPISHESVASVREGGNP